MKRYRFCFSIVALTAALVSCDDGNTAAIYTDGGEPKVAFASSVLVRSLIPADSSKILVPIYRTSTKGTEPEVTLSFTPGTAASGLFTLTDTTVSFEEGSAVAYAEIAYPAINNLSATTTYSMTLSIPDTVVWSPSQVSTISISLSRQLTFESYGTGVFTSTFFGQSWEQPILKAKEGSVYKLTDWISTGYDFMFSVNSDNTVSFEKQNTGYYYSDTYGYIYFKQNSNYTSRQTGNTVYLYGNYVFTSGAGWSVKLETLELP
jgi:hypothetical protein